MVLEFRVNRADEKEQGNNIFDSCEMRDSGSSAVVQQGVLAHRASTPRAGGRIWRGCWGTAL